MSFIYDLVPNRTLCRKLSKKDFTASTFVWFRINGGSFKDPYWVLETRERLNSLQVKLEYEIWLPAPSVEDLFEKLPEGASVHRVKDVKETRQYIAQYGHCFHDMELRTGKTSVEALAKLYIELKKEDLL